MKATITILDYEPKDQPWFEKFNRAWIEQFFVMEDIDVQVLQHPDQYILAKGGSILMAYVDNEVAGTVALKKSSEGVYEFTKMAVGDMFRGKGVGKELALAAIEKAKRLGALKIILYSSSRLQPALTLYTKLGFVNIPVDGPYKRSDVKMELIIKKDSN
jgi:GNAT superfamily N-acetyltransferase